MKVKYYLRGLGIGILLTTVILGISFNTKSKELTNEEIMTRAEALGMVREEDTIFPKNNKETEDLEEKEELTESQDGTDGIQEDSARNENNIEKDEEKIETSETTEADELDENREPDKIEITFKITSGMWSEDVSRLLAEVGLLENAGEFNTYLKNNGYQNRIQVGNYTIQKDATFEEIANRITAR